MAHIIGTSAVVYSAELPNAEAMREHLQTLIHDPIGEHELRRIRVGQTPHGDLVTAFPDGFAFTFLIEQKVIPHDVVQKELASAVAGFKQMEGRKPKNREKAELKRIIIDDMLPQAFVREKLVTCYYWEPLKLLVVPIASKNVAGQLMGRLIEAVESIKTTTIHISGLSQGLTARVKRRFTEDDGKAFDGFQIGDFLEIKNHSEREVYDREGLENSEQGILHSLHNGSFVKQLELKREQVTFRLTNDFQFRRIDVEYEIDEDEEEVWLMNAQLWLRFFADTVDALCTMVGYDPKAVEEAE